MTEFSFLCIFLTKLRVQLYRCSLPILSTLRVSIVSIVIWEVI